MGKCCREVLWGSVVRRSVVKECCGEVLWSSVVEKCCEGVLWRKCCERVLW